MNISGILLTSDPIVNTFQPWRRSQVCTLRDAITLPAKKRVDLAVQSVREHEREISRASQVQQSMLDDLRTARHIEALARRAADIDNIRGALFYIAALMKHSPFPTLDQYILKLQYSAGEIAYFKGQVFVYRMQQERSKSAALTKRSYEDRQASFQRFESIVLAFKKARSDLKIASSISPLKSSLRGGRVFATFLLQTQHNIHETTRLDFQQRVSIHAKEEPRRVLLELFKRKRDRVTSTMKALAKGLHDLLVLDAMTRMDAPHRSRLKVLASEKLKIQRDTRAIERHLKLLELIESLEDVIILLSRKLEAIPDARLPRLVDRAKDELAELDIKDQEQWDGHEVIRSRHRAEWKEERRQQRLMNRQKGLKGFSTQGRRDKFVRASIRRIS